MAIRLEASVKRYIGLSTDAKPTVGTSYDGTVITDNDLPAGSTFLEEDVFLADGTQRIARWNGKKWTYPLLAEAANPVADAFAVLRLELAALRLGMIDAGTCNLVDPADAKELVTA